MAKHKTTTNIRHPYYEMSDKLGALHEAAQKDPAMKEDAVLQGLIRVFCEGTATLQQHLNNNYIWD